MGGVVTKPCSGWVPVQTMRETPEGRERVDALYADMKVALVAVANGKPTNDVMAALAMTLAHVAILTTPDDCGFTGLSIAIEYLESCRVRSARVAQLMAHEPGRVEA